MAPNSTPPSDFPAPDLSGLCLAITEHAPLPMATVEGATHIIRYANPAFCRMMDIPADQLLGQQLSELLPQKDECIRLLDRVYQSGKPETFTEKDTAKPHPVFWSYTMWPVLADENLVGVMIQVTETAQVHGLTVAMNEALLLGSIRQHELTEAADKLNAQLQLEIAARHKTAKELAEKARLVDLSNDAIVVYDLHDKITLWNQGAEKLYGWTSLEALGKIVHSLLPTEFPKSLANIVTQLQQDGQFTGEVVQIARDEKRIPVLCRLVLDRATGSILASFTDISERKQFERERETLLVNEQSLRLESEAANRSKDIFLATLSHEMRTPLNAILGWASVIRRADCSPDELQEGIQVIERNVRAQAQLIDDVLDVSRIVAGKLQLEICPADLSVLINDAIDVVRPAAAAKNIQFQIELDPAASHIACDPHRMRQILWNLLANSVKFTPNDGIITIKLTRERSTTNIAIGDSGQGIERDLLPYIFDRFRQGEGGTKRKHGGLGLGLSIVKTLVELHGGKVSAHSEGLGHGALFTIALPLRAVQLETTPLSPDKNNHLALPRLDGLRILIVDDEADARDLLAKVLKHVGAITSTAESVTDALQIIDAFQPQILLSDVAMPIQDGYDLIRQVRQAGWLAKNLPAIAITAFAHRDDIRQALLAGFQMHVAKPIDPYDLITIIASMAGRTGFPPT